MLYDTPTQADEELQAARDCYLLHHYLLPPPERVFE